MAESVYTPSPWQQRFHSCRCNQALGAGAAGPGKTLCLLMDPLTDQLVGEHERAVNPEHPFRIQPGESVGLALFLRREASMLKEVLVKAKRIFKVIDPGVHWVNDTSGGATARFSCGYRYVFDHCKDPDDWEKFQGWEVTWIGYDELTQFLEEQFNQINSRLRTDDPILRHMRRVRAMSNPMMRKPTGASFVIRDPHWVRRMFVEPAREGNTELFYEVKRRDGSIVRRTRIYLPARLEDNPNKEFVQDYEVELLSQPLHIRKALKDGDWYVTADSFYTEYWDKQVHVIRPHVLKRHWRIFRSMDWGFKTWGTIGYWALDDDDRLIKFKEINFQRRTDEEVSGIVREYEERVGFWGAAGSRLTGPADTQLWEDRGSAAKTKAQVFLDRGIRWVPANKKSRQENAQRLLKRLKDIGGIGGLPAIMFFNTCEKTIATLPSIPTDPDNPECPLDGGDDHWHDEVCYAVAHASRGSAFIPRFEQDEDDFQPELGVRLGGMHGYGGV